MDFRRLIMKKAFTVMELVFVIVIIGLLATVAIPRFAATRDDAIVSKGRAEVAAIRSAIAMERQKRILSGKFDDITGSDVEGLMDYGLGDRWSLSVNTFTFRSPVGSCSFKVENNKLVKKTCSIGAMSDL
jgi:general secretion pathway protein G